MKRAHFISLSLIFFLCFCQGTITEQTQLVNTLQFVPDNLSVSQGRDIELSLKILGLKEPIFAISMQIAYDNDDIIKIDSATIKSGDCFGQDAVYFVTVIPKNIYVTITQIQGNLPVSGSGILCSLQISGASSGVCYLTIDPATILCYISDGSLIDVKIKTTPARITVQ